MANPEHVELVKQGAEAIRKWQDKDPGVPLDLYEADLSRADLSEADLSNTGLGKANLTEAILSKANLSGAMLSQADLSGADLARATLAEADLARANMTLVQGAHQARHLDTVQLREGDANYFERCYRPWPEHWLDWERLKVMGRLPLFGISYTALILIPIIFYGLALYNRYIDLVHAWAKEAIASLDHPLYRLAPRILEHLHHLTIPSLSFVLLVSTILLAAASTMYTAFCPSRIKEFSRDQWCDQLGRSLHHYWPLAWKHRCIRLASAACYALGGVGALSVLSTKVWHTALFILKHSTFPWPWR